MGCLPDRFENVHELGSGATSIVYQALDTKSGTTVAVKLLQKDSQEERFHLEGARLATLDHPNVVKFHESGRHAEREFLVMEYLEGGDLTSFLQGRDIAKILEVFLLVCSGLDYLHAKGIVHRDIKPANILIDAQGQPKITDLGVSRQVEEMNKVTKAGAILGTYAYLAPEQILSSEVGPAADIYSLGICLFEVLAGRHPFEVDNEFNLLRAHLEEKPPSLREMCPGATFELEELVRSMLAKEPGARPKTAQVVGDRLRSCLGAFERKEPVAPEGGQKDGSKPLSPTQRRVVLAVSYLKEVATFEKICRICDLVEDEVDAAVDELLTQRYLKSADNGVLVLTLPSDMASPRLSDRIRVLFQGRLESLSEPAPASPQGRLRSKRPFFLVAILLTGLLALLWFWSHSGSLLIASEPQGALVLIDGTVRGRTPVRVDSLRPGSRLVRLMLEGHLSEERDVVVLSWRSAPADFRLQPSRGVLSLLGAPKGSRVTINGVVYDSQEVREVNLDAGEARIKITKEGLEPFLRTVEVDPAAPHQLEVKMLPISKDVRCETTPEGATVLLDSVMVGKTPYLLKGVSFGKHSLKFVHQGFKTHRQSLDIKNSDPEAVKVELATNLGGLVITTHPKGAEVLINGKSMGTSPLTASGIAEGKVKVQAVLSGYINSSKTVMVTAGEEAALELRLSAKPSPQLIQGGQPLRWDSPSRPAPPPRSAPAPAPAPAPVVRPWEVQ